MPLFISTTGKDFATYIGLADKNDVVSVNRACGTFASVERGMIIGSINGAPVSDARQEQHHYSAYTGELLITFLKPQDEFDLDSDDDGNSSFHPATALPAEFKNPTVKNSADVILEAANKCAGGRCVIIMSEGANPALPVTLAARKAGAEVMYIDTVARMKTRQKIEDAGEVFKKSIEKGLWIYVEQATKSITLLRKLAECIAEVDAQKKTNPKSRIFLMCEPHPHFPEQLMKDSVTLRSRLQGTTTDAKVTEDLLTTKRRMNLIHGNDLGGSQGSVARPEVTSTKKKVKISSEVNIVHLEKSTFLEMSASARPQPDRENAQGDGLTRVAKYAFGSNEKFISLCKVGDHRFAVGTNSGYIVLLDSDGLPLIQFRPHRQCLWDISFASQFDFSTACEDGTSTIFNYSLAAQELTATSVASFQNDVFAVTYADTNDANSPVLSGGLSATICVLHSDRQNSSFIASGTSIQAMCTTQLRKVIVGGGNGACSLIDPVTCVVQDATNKHTRKVPAVSCHGNVAATGGFDKMLRLWDVRSGFALISEKTINEVITAVAVSDQYSVVCSGSDLFVWDLRNMTTPLASKPNAWKDLTRGLLIDHNLIVTASVDGLTRFWEIS